MAGNEAFISISNVSKHFGSVKAVDEVTFTIAEGEFFSFNWFMISRRTE